MSECSWYPTFFLEAGLNHELHCLVACHAVETVIAELRRRDRRIAAELLDETLAQRAEARVGTGAGGEGCRLQHHAQRQEHQCEVPAAGDVGSVLG
jgi:hypothetical protein